MHWLAFVPIGWFVLLGVYFYLFETFFLIQINRDLCDDKMITQIDLWTKKRSLPHEHTLSTQSTAAKKK